MHYNGGGKVNAEQMFEVEDKPGVVPQKQVKCWDVQLRCPIHPKSYKHVLKGCFLHISCVPELSCLQT